MTEGWNSYVKEFRKTFKDNGIDISYSQALVMSKDYYQKGVPLTSQKVPAPASVEVKEHPRKTASRKNKEANASYEENTKKQHDKRRRAKSKASDSDDSDDEVTYVSKRRPGRASKAKKTREVYSSDDSSEEEVVVVRRKPKLQSTKPKPKPKKVRYVYE